MILIPHIANANGNLEKFSERIQNAVKRAESIVVPRLEISRQVDISFAAIPQFLIPEDHIGGRTYTSEYIQISVDPSSEDIHEDTFFEMIVHELAHAARWAKNDEWMNTLFDGIINEGLATAFEEEMVQDSKIQQPQFFLKTVSLRTDADNEKILASLWEELGDKSYDYGAIFFDGKDNLPRWAGYSLGLYLVKKYLKLNEKPLKDALTDRYSDFRVALK